MFSHKYKEVFQKHKDTSVYTITLKSTSNYALEAILKYIYTAKIDINPANVEEILAAAVELGIDSLICMANDYLSSLSIGDVLDYMGNMLHKEGAELMFYELYSYMMTHLDKITRTPEYLKSSVGVVRALLGDSHLCVCSEMEVYEAVMRWIEFDRPSRIKCLPEAIRAVRFTLMTPDEIVSKIETQDVLMDNSSIFKMIYNAYKYHALSSNSNCKMTSFIKKEECRNVCLKGASVSDEFVASIVELSNIAHKLKETRAYTTNKILD
jgi:kelch-like protein 2/3